MRSWLEGSVERGEVGRVGVEMTKWVVFGWKKIRRRKKKMWPNSKTTTHLNSHLASFQFSTEWLKIPPGLKNGFLSVFIVWPHTYTSILPLDGVVISFYFGYNKTLSCSMQLKYERISSVTSMVKKMETYEQISYEQISSALKVQFNKISDRES